VAQVSNGTRFVTWTVFKYIISIAGVIATLAYAWNTADHLRFRSKQDVHSERILSVEKSMERTGESMLNMKDDMRDVKRDMREVRKGVDALLRLRGVDGPHPEGG